jgi:hypothetical protein
MASRKTTIGSKGGHQGDPPPSFDVRLCFGRYPPLLWPLSAFALAVKLNAVKMKRFASNVAIATG